MSEAEPMAPSEAQDHHVDEDLPDVAPDPSSAVSSPGAAPGVLLSGRCTRCGAWMVDPHRLPLVHTATHCDEVMAGVETAFAHQPRHGRPW